MRPARKKMEEKKKEGVTLLREEPKKTEDLPVKSPG